MNEIIILSRKEFDDLKTKIDYLIRLVSISGNQSNHQKIITNDQLLVEYGISKKTAQNWRTNGLIRFMRVGRKIYYEANDIHETLRNHSHEAFKSKVSLRRH